MSAESKPQVTAAIYLRQSVDADRDELAVRRQRAACQRIALDRGWLVVGEYVDNSISASQARKVRPSYDRLCADYASGMFGAVICWDLDRLTRQPRQLEDWIDAATDRGLLLVTANGEADLSTDGGRMYARIKASVARAEVERKAARQRLAAAQRAEQGRPPLGPPLTGYTTKGKVIQAEAKIVRKVFDRFAAGDSLRSIVAWLDNNGVPTRRGGKWSPSSVVTMLKNPRYAGRAVYDGRETGKSGEWKAIVKAEVFDAVQEQLRDPRRRAHQHGYDRKYIGSGIYTCAECGTPVISHTGAYQRYRCPNGCLVRSGVPIDDLVSRVVRARLADADVADLLPCADDGQVRAITDEIEKLGDRLAQIEADYDAGDIDGRRFRVATDKVTVDLTAARARLAGLTNAAGAAGDVLRAADPAAAFDASSLMLRRAVIDLLVTVRIHRAPRGSRTFRPETVEIEWKIDN